MGRMAFSPSELGLVGCVEWSEPYSEETLFGLGRTMVYQDDELALMAGRSLATPLVEGGEAIPVTKANVAEYLHHWSAHKLRSAGILRAIRAFQGGLFEVAPRELLSRATSTELRDLMCGIRILDVDDLARHMVITPQGSPDCEKLRWWIATVLRRWSHKKREELLIFATGLKRLPMGGAKELRPRLQWNVNSRMTTQHLPVAHTCSNAIELPMYESSELFERQLRNAIRLTSANGGAFGIA